MSIGKPSVNGRSREDRNCSAVTKYRGFIAVCDKTLGHPGDHEGTLANATTYSWPPETW